MNEKPLLSICVPSRNRQYYFQKTIEALVRNPRTDVEFVFADNSDDPSIMNDYMVALSKDPRVVYLPSADRTLSMIDNWERTVSASTGDWVSVVGDDDYIDPDLAIVLRKSTAANPDLEAFGWAVGHYTWPAEDVSIASIFIPFNATVVKVPRSEPLKRMFRWFEAAAMPNSGFSIYHAAVSRPLLERIKSLFGGAYFDNPMVDYDMAMKVIVAGKEFAFCARPFSIMGSCSLSNSYAVGRLEAMEERYNLFIAELGRNLDENYDFQDFPFSSLLGLTAAIGIVQQQFKKKYNLNYTDWEKNFVAACVANVELFREPRSHEIVRKGYEAAIAKWRRGKYLKYFNPVYTASSNGLTLGGSTADGTYIRSDIAGIKTPEDLYGVISAMTTQPDNIVVDADGLKLPWNVKRLEIGEGSGASTVAPVVERLQKPQKAQSR